MSWLKTFWQALTEPAPSRGASVATTSLFTPYAQQALALARKEADRFNHHFVGTEHLLLGLIRLEKGVAVNVLRKMGLDLETVRREVEKQVGMGTEEKMVGNIPYTPRVKQVLTLADEARRALNHTYLGTEHILLGILREGDGVAGRVLKNLGMDLEQTRQEILKELDPNYVPSVDQSKPSLSAASSSIKSNTIDTSKRYDVYCTEQNQQVVVYRNALFKGIKKLFLGNQYVTMSEFVELEQANGETVFLSRFSVMKFCEHGTTPGGETIPGKET